MPHRRTTQAPLQWLLAACGVLAGAVTHLVWDAFTHEGARGVRMLPVLDESMVQLGRHHLMGARLMQDASSLLGLIVILAIVLYGLRGGGREASPPWIAAYAPASVARGRGAYVLTALILSGLFFMLRHPAPTASLQRRSAVRPLPCCAALPSLSSA